MQIPSPHDASILPEKIKAIPPKELSQNGNESDRFVGSLVGLAVGDALGASSEFQPHQYFVDCPVRDMNGGGTWGLQTGQWTDDTSMALCLAYSLISKKCFDPYDQMVRYKWWYKHGYLSSTGHCFDIGNATRDSLEAFSRRQQSLKSYFSCYDERNLDSLSWKDVQSVKTFEINCSQDGVAGNGALMRLAPVPLFFHRFPVSAVEYAGRSALLTHGDQKACDACRYYAALIVGAIQGEDKRELLDDNFFTKNRKWFGSTDLHPDILRVAQGSYKRKGGYAEGIRGKGYIVNALEAALWAFWSDDDSFEKGALAAVNLGDDTDTTAAIYGQLAGAYYGYQKIPPKWRQKLYAQELLVCIGKWICFEGKQYEDTHNEQKTISATQSTGASTSKQYQETKSGQSLTHHPGSKSSSTDQVRDQSLAYRSQINDLHLRQSVVHHEAEKQLTSHRSHPYGSQSYQSDTRSSQGFQTDPKHQLPFGQDKKQILSSVVSRPDAFSSEQRDSQGSPMYGTSVLPSAAVYNLSDTHRIVTSFNQQGSTYQPHIDSSERHLNKTTNIRGGTNGYAYHGNHIEVRSNVTGDYSSGEQNRRRALQDNAYVNTRRYEQNNTKVAVNRFSNGSGKPLSMAHSLPTNYSGYSMYDSSSKSYGSHKRREF